MNVIRAAASAMLAVVLASPALATEPNGGYYEGLAVLYPYDPVFCDKNSGTGGPCFGMPGAAYFLPKSAPLPPGYKHCRWADIASMKWQPYGSSGAQVYAGGGWYQWEPRTITLYEKDAKVCYFEDRGQPKDINNLPRDDQ